ncbi:MAG: hypothetical protein IKZ20_02300 [Bacteroidaceae bacterium]|nr:hypothetical protein [Bacteroidaceae bacterium]
MRKITLFLALLFVTIGAVAQVYQVTDTKYTSAELNAKTEATYIAIKNLSATNHYYFVGNTGAAPYSKADFTNDAVFIWEPVAGETGKFYLKKLNGTYMQATSPKDFGTIENAAQFTTTNPTSTGSGPTKFNGDGDSQAYINGNDDSNLIRFVKGDKWINVQNGDSGTPTYNTGTGGWTIHYAYAVKEVEVDEAELLEAWKTKTLAILGYVGGYPTSMTETINAISTYADALAFDEANSGAKITLNTEAYYRLVCVSPKTGNGGNTSYNTLTYNGASNLVTAPESNSNVNQIFKFEDAGDGKYYLLNLNANKYLNKIAAGTYRSSVVEKTDACIIEILALNADAQWKFHNSESTNDKHCLFAENHPGEAVPYACSGWENGANSASAWHIRPVSELEVALTPIGGASYATGYYPFPVSVSGNTTLNVGTLNADKSKLSLTTAEGVPSNTGIVMVNSAAETTATLTIGGEFSVDNNALSGTCTAIALDGTNNSNYLVFGRSAGVLGFYRPSANVEAIAANKAFLATNELSAVKLNIGNDVTAIENVELGNGDAPIFDLSGRRVLAPVNGGIYIRDGKKYIVK